MKKRIEEMFCFAVIDNDGIEGIPAMQTPIGPMPLVGADLDRMRSLLGAVMSLEAHHGKKVRLYKFSRKEEIDWRAQLGIKV